MSFNRKGFTLVEIMIVVAIIALLAAIAIPNLLRARHNANEAATIGAMRTLSTAEESFRAAQSPARYANSLAELASANPPYIDSVLSAATSSSGSGKHGYYYTETSGTNTYSVTANPLVVNKTGTRVFYVDESGVVRLDNSAGTPVGQ